MNINDILKWHAVDLFCTALNLRLKYFREFLKRNAFRYYFKTLVLVLHFAYTEVDVISPSYFVTCVFLSFIHTANLLKQTLLRGATFFPRPVAGSCQCFRNSVFLISFSVWTYLVCLRPHFYFLRTAQLPLHTLTLTSMSFRTFSFPRAF